MKIYIADGCGFGFTGYRFRIYKGYSSRIYKGYRSGYIKDTGQDI